MLNEIFSILARMRQTWKTDCVVESKEPFPIQTASWSQPLQPHLVEEFDFVMAHNCLIVICDTIGDYTECLKRLKRYVRPGGHLVVQETLRETKSLIGSETFKMFPLQYDDVIKCFDEAGFITVETVQLNYNNTDSVFCDSNTGHFSLLQKPF